MLGIFYLLGIIFFISSSRAKKYYIKKKRSFDKNYSVSVIVPAKDEEENIAEIVETLLLQNYPKELIEIIVVNDRSKDKTKEIVESYIEDNDILKLINIKTVDGYLSGKQNALDIGIKSSESDVIIITDADCVVGKNWVKSMIRHFYSDDVGIVVGKTEIMQEDDNKTFLYKFQRIVHRLLMDVAQVPIIFGLYTSGMGNNLAFKRKGYFDIGGYEGLGDSILDDEILIRGFARKGYKVAASFCKNAVVETKAQESYEETMKQHKRWIVGSLNLYTPSGVITYVLAFINIYFVYLFFKVIVVAIFMKQFIYLEFLECLFKFVAEIILMVKLNREEDKIINSLDELLIALFSTFYISTVSIMAILHRKTTWKSDELKAPTSKREKK